MTDVTTGQDQDGAELSAANEQLLRELTERARTGGLTNRYLQDDHCRSMQKWY